MEDNLPSLPPTPARTARSQLTKAGKPIKPQKDRKQPTKAEIAQRTERVQQLILLCLTDGQIKKTCAAEWDCDTRSVETYLRRAREANVRESAFTTEEWRADQLTRYLRFASDKETPVALRIKVLERIDKLFGLEKNTLVHQFEDPGPANQRATLRDMQRDPDYIEYLRQKSAGNDAEECDRERDPDQPRDPGDEEGQAGDDGGDDEGERDPSELCQV